VNGFRIGRYSHEGTVSAINSPECQYSTGNWWHIHDPSINGFQVCDEVKEWWVWEGWLTDQLYFSGYVGDKARVFDATWVIVYSTFGRPKAVGDRSLFGGVNNFRLSSLWVHSSTAAVARSIAATSLRRLEYLTINRKNITKATRIFFCNYFQFSLQI